MTFSLYDLLRKNVLILGGGCSSTFPPHQITSITRRYCIASIEPFCDCILLAKTHLVPISVRTHLLHRCLLCTVLCTRKYKWKRPEFHRFCRTSLHNLKKGTKEKQISIHHSNQGLSSFIFTSTSPVMDAGQC